MMFSPIAATLVSALVLTPAPTALPLGHQQTSAVAVNPADSSEVWVCNRDNGSVGVVDVDAGALLAEVAVGSFPRSLAFLSDGSRVYVANQRGDLALHANYLTFDGTEVRASISVIDAPNRTVLTTLEDVGVEPYGLVVAPNDKWLVVSGLTSGTLEFFDTQTLAKLHTHTFEASLDVLAPGRTVADADTNGDYLADLAMPRALLLTASGDRVYVTHLVSGFVSTLDLTLDPSGLPTGSAEVERVDLNGYAPHPIFDPTPVQVVASQGVPRFLDDFALSPDGSVALVPHVLHNVNHDVSFPFPSLLGDYANQVYPALGVLDLSGPAASVARLSHEHADGDPPAEYVPVGSGVAAGGSVVSFGGTGSPVLGGTAELLLRGPDVPGAAAVVFVGVPVEVPLGAPGTLYCLPTEGFFSMSASGGGLHELSGTLSSNPAFAGVTLRLQAVLVEPSLDYHMSNGLDLVLASTGHASGELGHRAGHPGRAAFSQAGHRALLLNRASEDVFLYDVDGGVLTLRTAFPRRHAHVERTPLDTSTPLGDLPLGWAVVDDASTGNDDARVFVQNELTRTLSRLRVDWETGVVSADGAQIPTIAGPDVQTVSARTGAELLEDASRAQTAGGFNNSCASCHFEGLTDGNAWPSISGPRATPSLAGGPPLTGIQTWKGMRLNLGEAGPFFAAKNGGTGVLDDLERKALIDAHRTIPVAVNPHLDPLTGSLSGAAEFGRDLFFGTNDTGLNPSGRHAGCAACHGESAVGGATAFYTVDSLDPLLTDTIDGLDKFDVFCFSLQENLLALNLRNVNSAVNVDQDQTPGPDPDRNSDGFVDVETYTPLFPDTSIAFTRDDPNSYPCPQDPVSDPLGPQKVFLRAATLFSVPTLLGSAASAPFGHDHGISSLRMLLDPAGQQTDPVYGSPGFNGLNKHLNEFHDLRGDETFVPGVSKVQFTLQSTDVDGDLEAILAFVRSL